MFLAATGTDVAKIVEMFRLGSGGLAEVVGSVHRPIPEPDASPASFPMTETIFPPDDDDDPAETETPYDRRRRLLGDLPRGAGVQLAAEVPGVRGMVLFAAARGDHPAGVARTLRLTEDDGTPVDRTTFGPDDP